VLKAIVLWNNCIPVHSHSYYIPNWTLLFERLRFLVAIKIMCVFTHISLWSSKVTGCVLGNLGSIPGRGERFFSSPLLCLDDPGSHPAFCLMSTKGFFPESKVKCVKLTTHLHIGPRLIMHEAIPLLFHTFSRCGV
jgi:hypothetical protein